MSGRDKNKIEQSMKFKMGDLIVDPNGVHMFVVRVKKDYSYALYGLHDPDYVDVYPKSIIDKNCRLVNTT